MAPLTVIMLMSLFLAFDKAQDTVLPTSTADSIENYINSEYDEMGNNRTDYFANDTINCGTAICNIQCDVHSGCYGSTINALYATTLNVQCNNDSSCYDMYISAHSTTSIYIVCSGNYSCCNMDIYADLAPTLTLVCTEQRSCSNISISTDTAQHIDIECNWNASMSTPYQWPYKYGSCYMLSLLARNSGTTNLYCTTNNCAYAHIYLSNAISAIVNMEGNNAAYQAYLYTENMRTELDVTCTGNNACYYTSLVAGTMTGDVYVTCQGDPGEMPCQSAAWFTSDINGSLTVDCIDQYNCQSTKVYCPDECNVNCLASYSCHSTDVYIGNHFDNSINLDCGQNISTSCILTNIRCLDTGGRTQLDFDSAASEWVCVSYGCCPYQIGTIVCEAGKDCKVDCTADKCAGYYIDGRSAISLDVNCTGIYGCEASKIDCPVGDATSCFINCVGGWYSCAYVIVETDISQMDEFKLYCSNSSASCWAMDISLNSIISTVNISCGCPYINIRATSIIYNLEIDCSSCQQANFELSTANTVRLSCGEYGCSGARFQGITDILNMQCKGHWSCSFMTFKYTINNNDFVLDCPADSCVQSNITLIATKPATNIAINCINKLTTSGFEVGRAACTNTHFNIYGYNNNLSLQCGEYDCYGIEFYGYSAYNVDIGCNYPYSCQGMYLDVNSSNYLTLNCNDSYACNAANVYCAYKDIGSCDIHCSSIGFTCSDMQIYVPDSYVYDYLDLICDSVALTKNGSTYDSAYTCSNVMVNCYTGNRLQIEYLYNETIDGYKCSSTGNTFCCPYYDGPTMDPTETPTVDGIRSTVDYVDGISQSRGGFYPFILFFIITITI